MQLPFRAQAHLSIAAREITDGSASHVLHSHVSLKSNKRGTHLSGNIMAVAVIVAADGQRAWNSMLIAMFKLPTRIAILPTAEQHHILHIIPHLLGIAIYNFSAASP